MKVQVVANVMRAKEIAIVLARHGFAEIIEQIETPNAWWQRFVPTPKEHRSTVERMACVRDIDPLFRIRGLFARNQERAIASPPRWRGTIEEVNAAFKSAAVTVKKRIVNQRLVANAMEPRACVARFDDATGDLTLWVTSQNPHVHRLLMCAFVLGIPEHKVRVIAPDVGGGFGSNSTVRV